MRIRQTVVISTYSILGVMAFLNLAYVLYQYVVLGTYLDHAEPDTAILAWRFASGLPLYLPNDAAEHITTAYGPMLFILTALPYLVLGPSIAVSKLAATMSLGLATLIFATYVWRRFGTRYVGLAVILYTCFPLIVAPVSFWVRPDAHMVMLVTIALMATLAEDKDRHWVTAVVVAVCAGLAMNQKIYAFIFFVPLVFRYCLDDWVRKWPVMAVISVAIFLLPFALPNVSMLNYVIGIASVIGERPITFPGILKALKWTPIFLLPGALMLISPWIGGKRASWADQIYLAAFTICLVATYYPSSAAGSTWRQMLPFFPLGLDLFFRFLRLQEDNYRAWLVGSFAVTVSLGMIAVAPERRILRAFETDSWGVIAGREVSELIGRYPDQVIQMGYGQASQIGYPTTYLRPLLAFAGHPVTVSSPSAMERQYAGQPFPSSKLDWIKTCKTQLWLIPISVSNTYGDNPFAINRAFPKEVETAFRTSYERREVHGRYQIWSCMEGAINPF